MKIKIKRKTITLALAVLVVLAVIAGVWWYGGGVKTWYVGKLGHPVVATLMKDGQLVIRGWGAMRDYDKYPIPDDLYDHGFSGRVTGVVIKGGVTRIGLGAFSVFVGLSSFTFEKEGVDIARSEYDLFNSSLYNLYRMEGAGTYIRQSTVWTKWGGNTFLKYDLPVAKTGAELLPEYDNGAQPCIPGALVTVTQDMIYLDNEPIMPLSDLDTQSDVSGGALDDKLRERENMRENIRKLFGLNCFSRDITVLADKNTRFDVLFKILNVIQYQHDYDNINFAAASADPAKLSFIQMNIPRRVYLSGLLNKVGFGGALTTKMRSEGLKARGSR